MVNTLTCLANIGQRALMPTLMPILLVAILGLSACASPYPLGMSEEQWNALSTDERKTLLVKQQAYQEEQRLAKQQADAKARELSLQLEIAERARLEKLYQQPQNGNVMMVNVLEGQYRSGKRQLRLVEASYLIARGESQFIELVLEDAKHRTITTVNAYLHYDINGNGLYLAFDRYQNAQRIALLRDGQWNCGTTYQKNLMTSYQQLLGVHFYVQEQGAQCRGHRR
ncbi:hypothetical protein [Thiomicrorhabdus aquaedulcis]|uniref:hypothetical protein n=1 Tax=Thiomicrorhabdus aquaedulcis TaxID=2211106 RepID=UPI000FD71CC3|nr:hypothetical protein [Thiomicrorhabdus aquaedulcis]